MDSRKVLCVLAALLCWSGANAVEWDVVPSISISETYTDNLALGRQMDDEFITEIEPGVAIGATGKRFEIDFQYRLQTLLYSRRDDLDNTLHFSNTKGTAKLIGDSVAVDFSGALSQQIIDPGGRIGISSVSQGNSTQVGRFSVEPYWKKQFGSAGIIRVGYQYGLLEYDAVTAPNSSAPNSQFKLTDSESSGITLAISGKPPRSPWSWSINGSDSTIDYDTGAEVSLRRIGAEIALSLGGGTAIFVAGGDENNEFNQILGTQKIDGAFWSVGVRGQLDKLTTYSISAGEQHFGNSYEFSLIRNSGLLTTDISYIEETTTVGRQSQNYDALFQFLTDVTGVELPTPGAEVYVRKRLTGKATLELARSRLLLNVYNENRDYLTTFFGGSDGVSGAALSWTWTAQPRTEISIETGWQGFDLRDSANTPEDIRLQFRAKRKLANSMNVNMRAWRNNRSGTVGQSEYTENAISVGLSKRF